MIPYANMAPVRTLGCPDGFAFLYLTPKQSVDALIASRVVAAPLPTGALPAVQDQVEPLGHYGVAASGAVGSVLLYSKKRFELLNASDRISLTGQSATSVLLLYLLLRAAREDARPPSIDKLPGIKREGERPREPLDIPAPVASRREADAVLLIGDDALVEDAKQAFPFRYDLATLWSARFGKPMVFCRWVVRRDAPAAVKAKLLAWLGELDARDDALVEQSATNEARRLGISRQKMVTYLRGMRRVLTADDLDGQACFLEQAKNVFAEYQAWRKSEPGSIAETSSGAGGPALPLRDDVEVGRGRRTRRGEDPKLFNFSPPSVTGAASSMAPAPDAAERLDRATSLRLLRDAPLGELMAMSHAERMRRHPGGLVPFVMDTNPNYTNICTTHCTFCAFHRTGDAADAYMLTPAELAARVRLAANQGATTALLQGGTHHGITLARMLEYIRAIRTACPGIHIHPFSPSEIDAVARLEKKPIEFVLQTLWEEGIHTIPGGGAEILVDRVRQIVSPAKCGADRWLEVMETAHRLGFRTTATMMYGHVETDEEIVEHLFRLRDVQDRTGGFSSFIAWSFKPGNSPLSRTVPKPAHPALYVRIIALARLVLDNFEHIQSSWFSESENAGSLGLMAGANDFGGILVEENVLKTTGHDRSTTVEKVKTLIRKSGFVPARRDSDYRIVEVYATESRSGIPA